MQKNGGLFFKIGALVTKIHAFKVQKCHFRAYLRTPNQFFHTCIECRAGKKVRGFLEYEKSFATVVY